MSLSPSSKNNPCPICENASGKCRQGKNDSHYWQCMTYGDVRKGEIVGGFKCIGHTKDRLWGQFKPDTSQEWSEEQRQGWHQENERRQQKKAKEDEQRRRQSLSIEERDRQYRQMLSELSLHPDDRADLVRRGFTHEQIELSGFKSIQRYQQLQSKFSTLLPGIADGGHTLRVEGGYLCPVRTPDGLIVALQIRLRGIDLNKYRWESSKTEKNPQGQSPHLYDWEVPELPLAVHYPAEAREDSNRIGLTEGTGAKPFLTAQRLNIPVIGAAGGQFPSSPNQLKAYLQQIGERLGTQQDIIPTLFPDAGAIQNKSVLNQIHKTVELLEKSGYRIEIAWWNQIEKAHPDIDELPKEQLADIQYLSFTEFEALIKGDPTEAIPLNKGFGSSEPEWKGQARAAWRKNRRFLADIQENTKWCNFPLPAANTIAFFKAGLGRGKSTRLKSWVEEWKQTEDVSFICLGYRNTLLLQLCGEKKGLGFYHLHEHSGMSMKSAPGEGIALCVDSLWRFSPEDFDGKIIILDEVKSVVKHLLNSSTVKNRDKIISLFTEAIKRARQVICLDGLMADWVVDYLHSLAPEKQIIKAENTYKGEKPRVNFLLGTVGTEGTTKVNDRSPWLKYLLEDSPMPAVCSDSQVMIEGLDELLSAKGLKVLRVDSKTVPEQYVKDFLLDCDAYIEQHRPDVLLYTPSAESGVDVSIPNHFTHHFAFFFGVLDIDGILQMIGRIRDNITKFVWCKNFVSDDERQHSNSPFTETVAKSINEILIGDITTSLDQDNWLDKVSSHLKTVIANSIDQNFRTSCIIKSIQNYEKSNLRECLREVLVESGYKVVDCTLDNHNESAEKTKAATEQVKRQNSADILNAEKISLELVDDLKFDATWEERCKIIQAKLRERLPGIDETSVWTADFIYKIRYDDRNFISNLENYWLFNHPDVARRQSQDNLHWMARRLHIFIGNVKSRWARIHALLEMNFQQFLNPEREWASDSPELITLLELGKKYSNALGKHPGKSTPVRFFTSLLSLFGLKLKSRKDGEGKRWYRLNEEVLNDPIRQQVLACIETKLTQPKEEIDWQAALNEAHGQQAETQPQIQSEQDLEVTALSPKVLYINQVECAVNNLESQKEGNEADQMAIALPFNELPGDDAAAAERVACGLVKEIAQDFSLCDCPEAVAAVIGAYSEVSGYEPEMVEEVIAIQDSAPLRNQLREWLEGLTSLPTVGAAGESIHPPVKSLPEPDKPQIRQGSQVRVKKSVARCSWVQGLSGVVEYVTGLGRCLVKFCNGRIELFDDSDLLPLPAG